MITNGIEVILTDGVNDLSIFYRMYEWSAAQKWYSLLKNAIDKKYTLLSDTSFYINKNDRYELFKKMNRSIDLINQKYNLNIDSVDEKNIDLNELHRKTSMIDGDLWKDINDQIHAYEQCISQQDREPRANAYFQFKEKEYIPLEDSDYLFFTADRNYGDLCLNYTYKGKHWLELASDDDLLALDDGQFKKEDRIEAGGYMLFRPPSPTPFYRLNKFVEWYKENISRDFYLDMGIGYLLIGKLVMPDEWNLLCNDKRAEWTKFLCSHKKIQEIKVIDFSMNNLTDYMKISKML